MEDDLNMADLLLKKDCPFDYQCRDMDCMECIENRGDEKSDYCPRSAHSVERLF